MHIPFRLPRRALLLAAPMLAIAAGIAYNTIGKRSDGSILIPTGQLIRPAAG